MMRNTLLGFLAVLGASFLTVADAYETPTHEDITRAAGERSAVDEVLKTRLGLTAGLDTRVLGERLSDWLRRGGRSEDNLLRFLNHFHNPLVDWSVAGLQGSLGQSSILWGQNTSLSGWSWLDARNAYFEGLTRPLPSDRETKLARAFEGIGRQAHLVQDAASPAHTRNDPHLLYNYESLVNQVRHAESNIFEAWLDAAPDAPDVPDSGWQLLDSHSLAPVATARLIDTDRYLGANPGVTTGALIGLAEYTNANFFSEDRIFTENDVDTLKRFPYPNRSSVIEQDFDVSINGATVKRRYFVKTTDGATGYRLATVGLLRDYQQRFSLDWTRFRESPALDEAVYRDYAQRLVPRAVAYSTALLDYFFRGNVVAFGTDLSFGLENNSDEAMDGTFTLYYDDVSDARRPVPGGQWTRALAPSGFVEDLSVSPPSNPPPKEPGTYMLVFRGALGSEREAVVGRQVFIESVLVAHLIKRSDGTPHRGAAIQAIDRQTGEILSSSVTDQDGRVVLTWKPGRTVLFIPSINFFPMYWAGSSTFSSSIEGGRIVQTTDLDAQRQVTIPVPLISAAWPERIEACTEKPLFAHQPNGFFQQSVPFSEGLLDFVSVMYIANLVTFIRDDNGQETVLCGADTHAGCTNPGVGFIAEDVNRVGQVVGRLVRDMFSRHVRQIITEGGGAPVESICDTEYSEVEVIPVTVAEE